MTDKIDEISFTTEIQDKYFKELKDKREEKIERIYFNTVRDGKVIRCYYEFDNQKGEIYELNDSLKDY